VGRENKRIQLREWEIDAEYQRAIALYENALKLGWPLVCLGNVVYLLGYAERRGFWREPASKEDLLSVFSRTTQYLRRHKEDGNWVYEEGIPRSLVQLARGKGVFADCLENMENIYTNPYLSREGQIVMKNGLSFKEVRKNGHLKRVAVVDINEGYEERSENFLAVEDSIMSRLKGINEMKPTFEDMERARNIMADFYIDYEFSDRSSYASILAFALTPLLKPFIKASVPLFMVMAAKSQSGKSLLVKMTVQAVTGQLPPSFVPNFINQDKFAEELFSKLLEGFSIIFMDDVSQSSGMIRSNFLNSVLTSETVTRRILGITSSATVNSNVIMVMTANNPKKSEDIKNRSYICNLNKPALNKQYRHVFPLEYAEEKRGDVLWALFVFIRNWIVNAGAEPFLKYKMGPYPEWSAITGGVLEAAGIPGFLEGTMAQMSESEDWEDDIGELAKALFEGYRNKAGETLFRGSADWISVTEMIPVAGELELIEKTQNAHKDREALQRLLHRAENAALPNGYKLIKDHRKKTWKVIKNGQDK
jgi:hypothetical protein